MSNSNPVISKHLKDNAQVVFSNDPEEEKLKEELFDAFFKLDGLKVKNIKPNPLYENSLKECDKIVKEYIGPHLKTDECLYDYTGYGFHKLKNINVLWFGLIHNLFLFYLDDYLDKNPEEVKTWVKYFDEKSTPGVTDLEKMIDVLYEQGRKLGIPERYFNGMFELDIEWIVVGYKGLTELWNGKEVTDEQLIEFRLIDVGFKGQAYLFEIEAHFCGLDVDEELAKNKDWVEFNRQTARNFTLVNEICSLRKEAKIGLFKSNYIYVKMKNHGYSALEAMEEVLIEMKESYFLSKACGQRLKKLKIPGMDLYVENTIGLLEGELYWSTQCDRYNNFSDPKYNRYKFEID